MTLATGRLRRRSLRVAATLFAGLATLVAAGSAAGQAIALTGATVHTGDGTMIEGGAVLIRDGRIVAVAPAATIRITSDFEIIDVTGKVVTPGLIEAASQLGLVEVGSVPNTRNASLNDGDNRARFRASLGLDPRSMLFPIVRYEGVTNAISAPSGGLVSGQGMALSLGGRTRADVLLRDGVALYATLGPDAAGSAGGSRGGVVLALRGALDEAREEMDDAEGELDLADFDDDVAPFVAVLSGEMPLVLRASAATDIEMALELQAEYGFRLILEGGEEAWLLADRLAAAAVPVIIQALENRPTQFHRLATRYEGPGILAAAGVRVILTTASSHRAGQLPHEAGNAIRYGMDWNAALRAVTIEPARAFGLDDELGTLEQGKLANVVVWSGDPFDFPGYAERVWIRGQEMDMDSRQRRLFERYRTVP